MLFPNHILLDIKNKRNVNSNKNWLFKHFFFIKQNVFMFSYCTSLKIYLFKKETIFLNKLLKTPQKYTLKYKPTNQYHYFNEDQKKYYEFFFKSNEKITNKTNHIKNLEKTVPQFKKNIKIKFNEKNIKIFYKNLNFKKKIISKTNLLWSLFDINFLKKEKIYTKLKYSRVPQYDIVSGGVAALFAGFLGFLICEKFGFELLDSGDFYILFMYLVFLCFSIKIYLKLLNSEKSSWNFLSFKWLIYFYYTLFTLTVKKLSKINK